MYEYEVGHKVVLISGGPVMTVADRYQTTNNGDWCYRCMWFTEDDHVFEAGFPAATLRPEPRVMG